MLFNISQVCTATSEPAGVSNGVAARLWAEMSLDQKQRLQRVLFPEGITLLENGENRTGATGPVFSLLQPGNGKKSQMAAQVSASWNRIVAF